MKKIWICASLCAIAMALFVSAVHATSSIARATGKDCGYCHVDTGGGGTLTAAGQYYLSHGTLPPAAPTAPTALAATAASATQINLSWTDNSSDETGFKVERATSASGPWSSPATLAAGVRTYSSTGLTASTLYYYRVYAYNDGGNSGYATGSATTQDATPPPPPPPTPTVPAAPTGLTATAASTSQINLSWTDNSSDEAGFKVERGASASGPWIAAVTLGAGVTAYSNNGLVASTAYHYRVRAYNATGNSGYSNTANATTQSTAPPPPPPTPTAPAAPAGLNAAAVSTSQINLSWTDSSSDETGFKVERGASASGPWSAAVTLGAGVTTYSSAGLSASTAYYYRVCAYNATGNSDYSNTASAVTPATAPPPPPPPVTTPPPTRRPAPPSGLVASAVSARQINLHWTDNSANETGFRVLRSLRSNRLFSVIATLPAGTTSYSSVRLRPSTMYYYIVCAHGKRGNPAYSNTASAVTYAP